MMLRKSGLIAVISLLACLLLPARAATPDRHNKVLDLGVRSLVLPSAIYAEALRRDRILRAGLARLGWSLQLHYFDNGKEIVDQLGMGRLEAAIVGDVPTVIALARHDMRAVATTRHGFNAVVSQGVETLDQLEGKRIGIARGTSPHYALYEALQSAGVTEKEIALSEMKISAMPAALDEQKIDAFAAWPPIARPGHCGACPGRTIYRSLSNDYLLLHAPLLEAAPEVARQLVAALLRAHFWLQEDSNRLQRAAHWLLPERPLAGPRVRPSAEDIIAILQRDALNVPGMPLLPEHERGPAARLARRLDFAKVCGLIDNQTHWQAIARRMLPEPAEAVLLHTERYRIRTYDYE